MNPLAILIFIAQLTQFIGVTWQTDAMVAGGLAIIYLLPRLTKAGNHACAADRGKTPGPPYYFVSGLADTASIRNAADQGVTILQKPFDLDQLLSALKEL